MGLLNNEAASGQAAGWATALWVWCYCIVWWWIQDFCKVMVYKLCRQYSLFGAQPLESTRTRGDGYIYEPLTDVSVNQNDSKIDSPSGRRLCAAV